MHDHAPSHLYDLADELYRLAPWTWMDETQLIGLRHPDSGELGWMSMMGAAGNHTSLAVYLGPEPVSRFNLVQDDAGGGGGLTHDDTLRLIFEARQLQVSFARREELFKEEMVEIKALGRKYRGENWPCFRSFHPGRAPVRAGAEEVEWLADALANMAAVAPRLRDDPVAHLQLRSGGTVVLTRESADGVWHDTWTPEDTRLYQWPEPGPPGEFLVAKMARKVSLVDIECAFQLVPTPVGRPNDSAVLPYLMLSVDRASGFVLGFEMLGVEDQSFEAMIASVPEHFLKTWDRHSSRPASLRTASAATEALLRKTAEAMGVPLIREARLPALEDALAGVMGFLHPRSN